MCNCARKKINEITVPQFQGEADSWLGTPFRHLTSVKQRGTDCIGLVLGVYRQFGILKNVKLPHYPFDWWLHAESNGVFDLLKSQLTLEKLHDNFQVGDVMVYSYGRADEAHVGLYTARNTLIHSVADIGVIESRLDEPRYAKRLQHAYRLSEVSILQ